jgi:hypothetical protein
VTKSGGLGFEGLDLELVDGDGKVVGQARSDFDGFFLFERVAYGRYTIRVSKDSAAAAKIMTGLGAGFEVSAAKSVVRLGTIAVSPLPQVASAGEPVAQP